MYCEDPALRYRINGVPKAVMPTDVSLAIGYKPLDAHSDQPPEPWSWEHHRKSTITAEPNSRCINGREGGVKVFMDG